VSDLPRALDFYTETLGFEPAYVTSSDWAMVSMAGTTLSLIPVPGYVAPRILGGSHPAHLGIVLATAADVDAWHQRLQFTDVPAIEAPQAHRDGSYGFYLTDPDGNPLECIFIPYRLQGTARPGPTDEAVVLLAQDDRAISTAQGLIGGLQRHAPDVAVGLAPGQADLAAVARQLAAHGGIRRVRIVPVALAVDEGNAANLSACLDAARAACPGVTFSLSDAIGGHPLVQEAMVGAIVDLLETGR
jgi:catechol 2,3-dioxygenase-like lactoylglutathione lyase family enzyme